VLTKLNANVCNPAEMAVFPSFRCCAGRASLEEERDSGARAKTDGTEIGLMISEARHLEPAAAPQDRNAKVRLNEDALMKARDVMVSPVITVGENETVRDLARLLVTKRISATPVIDSAGELVGIVTEADLMRRVEAGTERPQSWWLSLISGDSAIAGEYVKSHGKR
jgi:hypothetical protein